MISIRRTTALCGSFAICCTSFAQTWTAQVIHPAGYADSAIWGGPAANEGPYLGGQAFTSGPRQAAVFDVNGLVAILSTPNASTSVIAGSDGADFAGWATIGGAEHAIFWQAAGAGIWNAIDLHVGGNSSSQARDNFAGVVVGSVTNGPRHAALWTANQSYVDLHPLGRSSSEAYSMDARFQVGHADNRAAIWRGTRRSYRDAHPAGFNDSYIYKADGGLGCGYSTSPFHALIWDLKNGKYRDIHPASASFSAATEVNAELGLVGGYVNDRATIWTLTTGTTTDLHSFLPAGYAVSEIYAIWRDGPAVRVGGLASVDGFYFQAVVWTFQ